MVGSGSIGTVGMCDGGPQSKLHKSASVTQLDLLMSDMKNDPRAMIHLAPRLEHSMQRLQGDWDSQDKRDRRKKKEREREKEKERGKEKDKNGTSKTGFRRSLSLKMRGEKKYERDRIGGVDRTKGKGKERESGEDDVEEHGSDSANCSYSSSCNSTHDTGDELSLIHI